MMSAQPPGALYETALDNARGRLLTLSAGLVAGGALVFTALNFNLLRRNSEQTDQRRTHELTEQGQITDRYTKAVEQLGSDKLDVRIGGIYALERVAWDSAVRRRPRPAGHSGTRRGGPITALYVKPRNAATCGHALAGSAASEPTVATSAYSAYQPPFMIAAVAGIFAAIWRLRAVLSLRALRRRLPPGKACRDFARWPVLGWPGGLASGRSGTGRRARPCAGRCGCGRLTFSAAARSAAKLS